MAFAYSCLEASAANHLHSHCRCLEDPAIVPEIHTVEEFIAKMKLYFQDPSLKNHANQALNTLQQCDMLFHDFITKFQENNITHNEETSPVRMLTSE